MRQKYLSYNDAPRHSWLDEFFRTIHNRIFIHWAKKRGIKCAGHSLDNQQVESVVACEDAQLVLASAGSGKTMSLLAKIEYIHRELGVPAEQILAISFTKKTVVELIERCAVKNVNICTFHGLGNGIVKMSASPELGARELIDDVAIADFIRRKITEFCKDEKFWRLLNDFVLFYHSAPASPGEFVNLAARVSFNRLYLRRALKGEDSKEFIRSKEEQLIANWLRIHRLKYEHQAQYPFLKTKYRPSFTVGDIYIDLLRLNRDGSSPEGKEYLRELKWRRKIHQKYHSKYIELYSYQ